MKEIYRRIYINGIGQNRTFIKLYSILIDLSFIIINCTFMELIHNEKRVFFREAFTNLVVFDSINYLFLFNLRFLEKFVVESESSSIYSINLSTSNSL